MNKLLADYNKNAVTNLNDLYPSNLNNEFIEGLNETIFNRFLTKQDYVRTVGAIGSEDLTSAIRNVLESTEFKQENQLQPVLTTKIGAIDKFMTWQDFMRKLEQQGVDTENYDSWGAVTQFNWVPPINLDKFINFRDYYWDTELHGVDKPDYITIKNTVIERELKYQQLLKAASDAFLDGTQIVASDELTNDIFVAGNVPSQYPVGKYLIIKFTDGTYYLSKIIATTFISVDSQTKITLEASFTGKIPSSVVKTEYTVTRDVIEPNKITLFSADYTQLFTEDYVFGLYDNAYEVETAVKVVSSEFDGVNTIITIDQNIASNLTILSLLTTLLSAYNETVYENGIAEINSWENDTFAKLLWLVRINRLTSNFGITYRTENKLTDASVNFITSEVEIGDTLEITAPSGNSIKCTITNVAANTVYFDTEDDAYVFSFANLTYSIYTNKLTSDYFTGTEIIWIDLENDTISFFESGDYVVKVKNFSYYYDDVKNRKIIIEQNDWSSTNSWIHRSQINTVSGKLRAQVPIIEFDNALILSDMSLATHNWSYRDTEANSYSPSTIEPTIFELNVIQKQVFADLEFDFPDSETIIFGSKYGNMTDYLKPGAVINLSGFNFNNGNYTVVDSVFEPYSPTGNALTSITIAPPLADISDKPIGGLVAPTVTANGDAYVSPYVHWRYDGIDNVISTSHQPDKNPMYSYVVTTNTNGIVENKLGYNWQSFAYVGLEETNPLFALSSTLHKQCLYDDYQEGDIRVYINKVRQYGNFIEIPSGVDDAFVGAIQFIDGTVVKIGDVVLIEVGEYATNDVGLRAVVVNTASGYEKTNLSRYKRSEQLKTELNQYPEFIVVDSYTKENHTVSSKIFSYTEDNSNPINPYIMKKLATSNSSQNSFVFTQHLKDDEKILGYKTVSVDGFEFNSIWKVGDNFERYLPYKNDSGEWVIPNNWYYNAYHENRDTISYTEMYNHFRSIIQSQTQPGLLSSMVNSYFADSNVNYGLGGTIKEHNGNLDLLMAATFVENVNVVELIDFAKEQYANALYKIQTLFYDNVSDLFAQEATSKDDLQEKIADGVIDLFESDSKYDFWFGDSSSYTNGVGIRNWILTLPRIGLLPPVKPYLVIDTDLGIYDVVHHDGHRSTVSITPAMRSILLRRMLDGKTYARDEVTNEAQSFPTIANVGPDAPRAVIDGDFLLRTNTTDRTITLYRLNGTLWERLTLTETLAETILEVENRLYEVSLQNYENVYDLSLVESNAKYSDKLKEEFDLYVASLGIVDPMSNKDRFSQNNPFTWNYYRTEPTTLPNAQEFVPAADWRQLYTNVFKTPYPHLEPWKVQGYIDKPEWWDAAYLVDGVYIIEMWDNIFANTIPSGQDAPEGGILGYTYLPVVTTVSATADGYEYGDLLPPYWNTANSTDPRVRSLYDPNVGDEIIVPSADFIFGQYGDIEYQWSISMDRLYDSLVIAYKLDPIKFFSKSFGALQYTIGCLELHRHTRNIEAASDTVFHGEMFNNESFVSSGLNQWYVNFNRYQGFSDTSEFYGMWRGSSMKLSYLFDSMIDSKTFAISSQLFDITEKDYAVLVKKTEDYAIHKLDSLNLTLTSMPSKYLGDVDKGWTVELSTIPTLKNPIVTYGVQNYNVNISGNTFVASSYPVTGINYESARSKVVILFNNLLTLDTETGLSTGTDYTCSVQIDSNPVMNITINGDDAVTIEDLITELNSQITEGSFDLELGNIVFFADSSVTSITITDVDLFSSVANFVSIESMTTIPTKFEKIIAIAGNYTTNFVTEDTFTITGSTLLNGDYTVVSSEYDYTNNETLIEVLEDVTLPLTSITVDGVVHLDKNIGIPDEWTTGTEIYFNSYESVTGLNLERPYYVIRQYDTVIVDSESTEVLNKYNFKIALTAAKAATGHAISLSGVTVAGILLAGKLERTFKALGGAATKINWRVHAVDERVERRMYDGVTITGIQNIVDFLHGFSSYNESQGFSLSNIVMDDEVGRPSSWELYIEKFIDWAYNTRLIRQESKPEYLVEAYPGDDSFLFLDSQIPNWAVGTTVVLSEATGASLPDEFDSSDLVTVPYYIVRPVTYTDRIKLAATALDAAKGNFITFNTASTGKIYMQVFEKFENRPYFNFNPFKEMIAIDQEVGLVSNIFENGNYVYSTDGEKLTTSQLFISRRDKRTEITLLGKIKDYNAIPRNRKIHIGGLKVSNATYEHVLSFENYSVANDLIYDAFLGLRTNRFYTEFNRQTTKTLRPTLGGYILHNNNLEQNIESAIDDSRYYYDVIKSTEGKETTNRVRKFIGYDGPKDYMTSIGLNSKSQFLFWKMMIQSKGTNFAIDAFTNQTGLAGAVVDEFWAYKLAEFGGTYKREYPEMKLLAADAARNELRIEFIPPNNTPIDATFTGVELTDMNRWWDQPDQMVANQPYDTFFFDTKIQKVVYDAQNSVEIIRGERLLVLNESCEGVIISYNDSGTIKYLVEETDFTFVNSEIIKFTTTVDPELLDDLTVVMLTYNFESQNPSKLIDRKAGVVVSDIPFWNPRINQHYLKAEAGIDMSSSVDPAKYSTRLNTSYADANNVWTSEMVGKVWMDTKNEGYVPYNDKKLFPNINDRIFNWGKLADWAEVELYQWTGSYFTPEEWDATALVHTNDYTIPDEIKITGNVKRILYRNTTPAQITPVWEAEEDQHGEFIAGLLIPGLAPNIVGDAVDIYVNGKFVYTRAITSSDDYLTIQDNYPTGFYIHVIKRAHVPTQDELDRNLYTYDTPYVLEKRINVISGKEENYYYYWVANKTNKLYVADRTYTLAGIKSDIISNPEPYMIIQGLRPTGSGYGLVYGNIFDEFGFELPYRFTQLIIKGLEGRIRDDERYTLRFTKDFNLRDRLESDNMIKKNVHEEWKLFREKQYSKVDRTLWNKLIEAIIGYKLTSDDSYDSNVSLPELNRVVYDNIYGKDSRIGFGEGQVFIDRQIAIDTIMDTLNDPTIDFSVDDIRSFIDSLDFTTPEDAINSLNTIYATLSIEEVNKIFFEVLHDAMALKKEHKEIFKTSWVALQISQDVVIDDNSSIMVSHSLTTGTCSGIAEPTPEPTPEPSPTPTPTVTPTPTPTITISPTPFIAPSVTPTPTVTATPTISVTPSITESVTPTPTISVTPSITESVTPTPTISVTPSITESVTPTPTPTVTPTPSPAPTDPYFASVISLLHFNGTNGSTTFTDVIGNTWSAAGNAQISTAQSQFGGASGIFDGSGDYIDSTNAAFALGTGDFTIEIWSRNENTAASAFYFDLRPASTEGLYPTIYSNGTTLKFYTNNSDRITGTGALSQGVFKHIALSRVSGVSRLFYDGVQIGSDYTDSNDYIGSRLRVGASGYDASTSINGYFDDLRITKGVGRYTTNFTPPTYQHPDS